MTAQQKIARLRTKKHRKLMQSLRCLFMMPYGVYCDTLHRLRSVQSLQLPLFLYEISITLNASFNQAEQLKAVSTYDGAEIFEEISEKGA